MSRFIEDERRQAEEFALRAMWSEEMGQDSLAQIFRELVACCDKKLELHQAAADSDFVVLLRQVHAEKLHEKNSGLK